MALVSYARVSSVSQSLDVQLDKLKDCRKIFQEKKSAADGKRPALRTCLEYVREGDNARRHPARPAGAFDAVSVLNRRRTQKKGSRSSIINLFIIELRTQKTEIFLLKFVSYCNLPIVTQSHFH